MTEQVQQERPKKKRKWLAWILAIIGIFLVLCIGIAIGSGGGGDTDQPAQQVGQQNDGDTEQVAQEPEPTPKPTPAPLPEAPPWSEIKDAQAELTEAQWNKYVEDELEGHRVAGWEGWLVEVNETLTGKYEAWVDPDSPDELLSVQNVEFALSEDTALELPKNAHLVYTGTIKSVVAVLGSPQITLEDVEFVVLED